MGVGIYVVRDNRHENRGSRQTTKQSEDNIKAQIKKLKSKVNDVHGRVVDLETKANGSNNGVYSLMQAAIGDKSLVKEMIFGCQ